MHGNGWVRMTAILLIYGFFGNLWCFSEIQSILEDALQRSSERWRISVAKTWIFVNSARRLNKQNSKSEILNGMENEMIGKKGSYRCLLPWNLCQLCLENFRTLTKYCCSTPRPLTENKWYIEYLTHSQLHCNNICEEKHELVTHGHQNVHRSACGWISSQANQLPGAKTVEMGSRSRTRQLSVLLEVNFQNRSKEAESLAKSWNRVSVLNSCVCTLFYSVWMKNIPVSAS